MKTIRPLKLGVGMRVLRRPDHLVVSITAPFVLGALGAERLATEQRLWTSLQEEVGDAVALDDGLAKVRGEVVVRGSAFAPGGAPCAVCQVRVVVGAIDKKLAVFGDRAWGVVGMVGPLPYTRMPVDWKHAFGGEGYEPNPEGKGWDASGAPGALPNVEDPRRLVVSRRDHPAPASFAPIPQHFASRRRKLGTYDAAWLLRRAPLPPEDADALANNAAPDDQQLHDGFFRGDEPVRIENMCADAPVLDGRLPGVTVRVFLKRKGEASLVELATRIDTIVLVPGAKLGAMIFRTTTRIADEDAEDVEVVMAAAEDLGAPKPLAHYEEALARRLDAKKGHRYLLRDGDLLPAGEPSGFESIRSQGRPEGLLAKHRRRRVEQSLEESRAKLVALGIDPDKHLPAAIPEPEDPPTFEQLPEELERVEARIEQMEAEAKAKRAEVKRTLAQAKAKREAVEAIARAVNEKAGVPYTPKPPAKAPSGGGPPKRVDQRLDELVEGLKLLGADADASVSAVEAKRSDPALRKKLEEAYRTELEAYRVSAHLLPAADALGADAAARRRAAVEAAREKGRRLAGRDLTGADLHGLDLSGVDLSGALLELADLSGASLRGANLSRAVLARANLSGADLAGAKLDEANLGRAELAGANLDLASLKKATLDQANLTGANLRGASLAGIKLGDARLEGVDLAEADLEGATLLRTRLPGQKLAGAKLTGATLFECDLTGADLRGASLEHATLARCCLDRADLRDADCLRVCIADHGSLEGADLRGAKLPHASILEASLREADLSGSTLDGANLLRSDLTKAKLYRATLRAARLDRVTLDLASLVACDLREASLLRASLRSADFTGANLFRADLNRARIDDATRFDHAEMTYAQTRDQVKA